MQKDNRVKEKERLKRIQPRPEHTHKKKLQISLLCAVFIYLIPCHVPCIL